MLRFQSLLTISGLQFTVPIRLRHVVSSHLFFCVYPAGLREGVLGFLLVSVLSLFLVECVSLMSFMCRWVIFNLSSIPTLSIWVSGGTVLFRSPSMPRRSALRHGEPLISFVTSLAVTGGRVFLLCVSCTLVLSVLFLDSVVFFSFFLFLGSR